MEKVFKIKASETAEVVGSGTLPVLSTPSLLAYMENVAQLDAGSYCQSGQTSVGIEVNMQHLKASLVGRDVRVVAKLAQQDKKILTYEIEAYQGENLIGKASHKRAIVDADRFMARLAD